MRWSCVLLPEAGYLRLVADWISGSTGLPATVRPTRLMILMQASVNFEVSTGLAAGFIFPEIPFYWRSNCSHSMYSAVLIKWLSGDGQ
jgi:hypothetical protein